ncbi:MAG: hypothetical protein K2Q10_01835, partial [Rhodospirillales bacterium]|nr:hypothetical protein [Rhodospirillales bacterium]
MRLILPPSAERRNSGILRVAAVPSEEIMRHLPERLRTEHWYADIHHALFLILFADLFQAVDNNKTKLIEYYIDTITMYWLIHCL